MLFATTIGEHAFYVFLAMCALVWIAFKVVVIADDDGEVRKTANDGLAAWIRRWLK